MRRLVALSALPLLLLACGHEPPPAEVPPADPVQDVSGEDLFAQGVAMAGRGDLIRAEQYLAAAMDRGHPQDQVMPVLLRVLVSASRLRVALDYAEPYLARHPEAWALRYLVGSIHLAMGDAAEARRELERVVETAPEEPDPYYLLAIVLRDEMGDPIAAEARFRRYLELAPEGTHASEARDALRRVDLPARPAAEAAAAEAAPAAAEPEAAAATEENGAPPPATPEENGT